MAFSSSMSSLSSMPSGMTWNTEPMVTSDALIGRPVGSFVRRVPFAHMVWRRSSLGSAAGARSRTRTMPGRGKAARAPIIELRISLRRLKPDSLSASWNASTALARVASVPRVLWRSSVISRSTTSDFDQYTAPRPSARRARAIDRPSQRLAVRTVPKLSESIGNAT